MKIASKNIYPTALLIWIAPQDPIYSGLSCEHPSMHQWMHLSILRPPLLLPPPPATLGELQGGPKATEKHNLSSVS